MSTSYSRRCKYCDRWISIRQMPAGQWVAFEGDSPHKCANPPKIKQDSYKPPSQPSTTATSGAGKTVLVDRKNHSEQPTHQPHAQPSQSTAFHAATPIENNGAASTKAENKNKNNWSWFWMLIILIILAKLALNIGRTINLPSH